MPKFNYFARRHYSPTACKCQAPVRNMAGMILSAGCGQHQGNPTNRANCPKGYRWVCPSCAAPVVVTPSTTPGFTNLYNGVCSAGCPGAPQMAPAATAAPMPAPRPYPTGPAPQHPGTAAEPAGPPRLEYEGDKPWMNERLGQFNGLLLQLGHTIQAPKVKGPWSIEVTCPECGDSARFYHDQYPKLPYGGALVQFRCKPRAKA